MFWTFDQNNSGGSFVIDKDRGITTYVIIEAYSRNNAIDRAESIGLYFDGCIEGIDCSCCGDRWYRPYEDEGDEVPTIYGFDIVKHGGLPDSMSWSGKVPNIAIHYRDGLIKWYDVIDKV